MASSGDYSFNPSTFQIITGAMRLIGAIQSGETPPAEEYDDALATLNGLIHAWQANNLHVWTQSFYSLTLVAGKNAYQIGIGAADLSDAPRPLKVTEARIVAAGGGEDPLIPMSRWDYANLQFKGDPGQPSQFFYDPQLPFGEFFVYPTPTAGGQVNFVGQRPLQSFDTQRDTADVPQEWISALRFALAVDLGPEYDCTAERLKIIKELADEKLAIVKGWDTEPAGTSPLPFTQTVYQLIAGALRLSGGCGPQDIPVLGLVNNGLHALNIMVQSWQAMGMHVWTQEQFTLTTTAGKNLYLIGTGGDVSTVSRPLRVSAARITAGTAVLPSPLIPMSRWDMGNLNLSTAPSKTPQQFFYDPQRPPTGEFVLNPTPDAVYTISLTAQRPLVTFGDLSAVADFPDEWMAALRYNLALALWHEHAERRAAILKNPAFSDYASLKLLADDSLAIVREWDKEAQGTTTLPFSQAVYQLVAGALRLCGGCSAQDTPTLGLVNNGFYALNAMIQSWQANNMHVWTQLNITLPVTAGKAVYQIGVGATDLNVARPLKVTEARLTVGQAETPLIPMSRWDYANLSDKVAPPGPPSQFFYDPQLPYGLFTVYPTPLLSGTVNFVCQRPLQTLDDLSSTIDFPVEWNAALRFNLALELWGEHAERRAATKGDYNLQALAAIAKDKLDVVKAWDVEAAGTTTLPFSQPVYQLIAGALRLCGGSGAQETPTLGLINNGFYSLNALVKQWQGQNIHLWTETDAILFLQPGQRNYRIGVGSPDHCCKSNAWHQTYLLNLGTTGGTVITVNSVSGISIADHIAVVLDAQPTVAPYYFWTTVAAVSPPNTLTLAAPLPSQASGGARVIAYTDDLVRPLKVPAGRRIVYPGNLGIPTKIETPLAVYSRITYGAQTNKDNPGQISAFFFDPQLGFAEFHTWPSPSDTNQAVQFTAQLPLATYQDLTTADNFPDEWVNAIRWNLAVELWPEHSEARSSRGASGKGAPNPYSAMSAAQEHQTVVQMAAEKLAIAQAWDREPESVYFGVSRYPATRNT